MQFHGSKLLERGMETFKSLFEVPRVVQPLTQLQEGVAEIVLLVAFSKHVSKPICRFYKTANTTT